MKIRNKEGKSRENGDAAPFKMPTFLKTGTKTAYLKDGVRQTDLILVYAPKLGFGAGLSGHEATNRVYRKNFLLKLKLLGLEMEIDRTLVTDPPTYFIKLHATWRFLARTAEMLHIQVPIAKNDDVPEQRCRCSQVPEGPVKFQDTLNIAFKRDHLRYYLNHEDVEHFFTPSQRTNMVVYEIDRTRVAMKDSDRRKAVDVNSDKQGSADAERDVVKVQKYVTFQWFLRYEVFMPYMVPHDSGTNMPKNMKVKDNEMPVRMWLNKHWANTRRIARAQPLDAVREYLGSEIAFYFAWLSYYTKLLTVPAALSLLVFAYGIYNSRTSPLTHAICDKYVNMTLCRRCPSLTCEYSTMGEHCESVEIASSFDNYGTFVFSLFISIWAVLFQESWRRKQFHLASRWGTLKGSEELIRAEYLFGATSTRKSPITLKEEPYVKKTDRLKRLAFSIVVVSVFIVMLLAFMIAVIAYRIISNQSHDMISEKFLAKFYISRKLFVSVTASIMNLIVISLMSMVYPKIAWKLTEYEFPRTRSKFERSYTYKVVIFQFFNYYGTIFYLSFFSGKLVTPPHLLPYFTTRCGPQGCMLEITVQLIIVMTGKQLLQNFTEMLFPILLNALRKARIIRRPELNEDNTLSQTEKDFVLNTVTEPTAFNDYLEMVIQYGFVSMFGPAFPLGTFFAMVNNIFEIRLDAHKYIKNYRRPIPRDVSGIGPWLDILRMITRLSVIVNAIVIAFSGLSIENLTFLTHHPGAPVGEYMHQAFSRFNTNDYCLRLDPSLCGMDFDAPELEYLNFNETVRKNATEKVIEMIRGLRYSAKFNRVIDECFYRGQFYPPGNSKLQYTHKPLHVNYLVAKIAFVIIFENVIILIQSIIGGLMPPQSELNKIRTLRETYLERQVEVKHTDSVQRRNRRNSRAIETTTNDEAEFTDSDSAGKDVGNGNLKEAALNEKVHFESVRRSFGEATSLKSDIAAAKRLFPRMARRRGFLCCNNCTCPNMFHL